ncbi:carbon-nitrogen hydrolase family protein [Streptomyces sp. NPDC005283]|uniref:carbon-nitrogen hydrolase family protein n=1 Tax=Streptomyces sp. NPDC005283 TaxID=3156871 RepID=UPI00345580BC
MRLALVQRRAQPRAPEENLRRGLDACAEAAALGADLVVFPELWQTGYAPRPSDEAAAQRWKELAIDESGPWVGSFRDAAASNRLAVVVTYMERHVGQVADAAAVIDCRGDIAHIYRKVHTCDFTWEKAFVPGEQFRAVDVKTAAGEVRLGVMICFDREQPESCRALALAGAELVVCPNASLLCDDRVGQVRTRAFENSVALAVANYPMPRMNGRSCAFDGRAVHLGRPRDHTLALADGREQIVTSTLDLDALRAYRTASIWGAAHRRPHAYAPLVQHAAAAGAARPQEPFDGSQE